MNRRPTWTTSRADVEALRQNGSDLLPAALIRCRASWVRQKQTYRSEDGIYRDWLRLLGESPNYIVMHWMEGRLGGWPGARTDSEITRVEGWREGKRRAGRKWQHLNCPSQSIYIPVSFMLLLYFLSLCHEYIYTVFSIKQAFFLGHYTSGMDNCALLTFFKPRHFLLVYWTSNNEAWVVL